MSPELMSAWREQLVSFGKGNCPSITRDELLYTFNHMPALVELPSYFTNFFTDLGIANKVRFFAMPLSLLPSANGKTIPAFQILENKNKTGKLRSCPVAIGASSGNTAFSIGRLLPLYNIEKFIAVIDKKTPKGKKAHLDLVDVEYVFPREGQTTIECAHELAEQNHYVEINQYQEHGSVSGHTHYTMPHIHRELESLHFKKPIVFVSAAAGTTSTLVAARKFSDFTELDWKVLGVASMSEEERVPGTRTIPSIRADIKFDWENSVNTMITGITCREAFAVSKKLYAGGLLGGPSAGLDVAGIIKYFWDLSPDELRALQHHPGDIVIVSIFMDTPLPYVEDYTNVLGTPLIEL